MKKLHLSTYISLTIAFLVVASTLTISGVLYLSLNKSLTSEFEDRVKAESGELGQALKNRFDTIESRLQALALDNTVRVTLMLGADQQLQEHLNRTYKTGQDPHFFIFKQKSKKYFTSSDLNINPSKILSYLSPASRGKILENNPLHGSTLTYSLPIFRQQDRIGDLVAVYLFSDDEFLKGLLGKDKSHRAILIKENKAWDLFSGRTLKITGQSNSSPNGSSFLSYLNIDGEKVITVSRDELPGLRFVATLDSLNEARKRVSLQVLLPAFVVVMLTVLLSLFLSRKLGFPLSQLSELALKAAEGKSDLSEGAVPSNIIEVERVMSSLSIMLENLRHAQELQRYQELFEGVADIVLIHDFSGRFIKVNKIASTMFGFSEEPFLNTYLTDIASKNQHQKIQKIFNELAKNGDETIFETTLVTKDGTHLFVECHARRILYQNQNVALNVVRDITDRRLAEKSQKESHQTLLTILNSIDATIYVADFETYEILFMNRYMKKLYGNNLEGKKCYKVFRKRSTPCSHCTNRKLVGPDNKPTGVVIWEGENPIINRWFINYDRAIRWVDRRLVRFQVAIDITVMKELERDRERSEAQLRKIQKMEAIGTLAGGVAHDLNNILTGIVSYPDLLLMQLPEDSQLRGSIITIKKTGEKAAAIVQDLLTLARRGVVNNEVINLNEIIAEYLKSPEHEKIMSFHKDVIVQTNLESDQLNILGSLVHLSKTIMNLVSNAAEAMQDGGVITISTETVYIDRPIGNYEEVKKGEYVVVSVADTGIGMLPEDSERIFEPFFTKKVMGRSGTGLGMSVVWGTVKDHEGYIDVKTAKGEGSTFSLYFPITREKLIKEKLSLPIENYKGNGESILVVDDVKEQRDVASMMFTQLGYTVDTVPSGEKAIEYLKNKSVDLVLLDMIMDPGIDGLETYKEIIELHPGQKALITSGYSETDRVREAQKLGVGQYIKKPYIFEKIAMAVKGELRRLQ
ncbi:MAG: PAS domain S-box protein [Desulfobacterales bacterium]|nr:PAS domain S-box protein [Desulfobacterales bacterium]